MMELILLYAAFVVCVACIVGIQNVVGFIVGTMAHGPFFQRRAARPVDPLAWFAAMTVFIFGTVPMTPLGRPGFYLGFLVYGYWYWDGTERTGTRTSSWFRSLGLWEVVRAVFQHHIIDDKRHMPCTLRGRIYACHPHGLMGLATVFAFIAPARDTNPPILLGMHWLLFAMPGMREIALALGGVDAQRDIVRRLLETGRSIALIPESTRDLAPHLTASYAPREGFLQIAYELNAELVAVECAGERDICCLFHPSFLDNTRVYFLRYYGYAFPTFFIGPWPWTPLSVRMGPIHRRRRKETFAAYKIRYARVREAVRVLSGCDGAVAQTRR